MVTLKLFILATVAFIPAVLYYKTSLAVSKDMKTVGRKGSFRPIPRKVFIFLLLVLLLAIQYIDFIASDEAAALAQRYYGNNSIIHLTYSALSSDKTAVLLAFLIASLFLSNKFADRVLLDLSDNSVVSIILLVLSFVLIIISFKFVVLAETVFVIILASCLYNYDDNYSRPQHATNASCA